ncbi:hypothetical protein SLEP1_g8249 [Rubroshorea leprosula]|uniref:Transmembrane protein n=1 Tax=Rubroshorea leprosula TaxID=152421 RepID=A0AAV5I785_9ROSI|nr:hypothetical protein SLEP1_g8249 [Rubroshorea leprosula]
MRPFCLVLLVFTMMFFITHTTLVHCRPLQAVKNEETSHEAVGRVEFIGKSSSEVDNTGRVLSATGDGAFTSTAGPSPKGPGH